MTGAALLYNGTEGFSGSDASAERAEREAHDGTASDRQASILDYLHRQGEYGGTWREVGAALGLHHGQVTGSLSNMHKAGHVARLRARRDRCSVYVHPDHVNGRETAAQGRRDAATSPVGFPYRLGDHLILGPEVHATLDGESIVWNGRRYHPVDSHDATGKTEAADVGKRPLFDLD